MALSLTFVDAFTDRPFTGNPAAVCRLEEPVPDRFLQAVAAEVNLSETAFLRARAEGDYDLRWFTPTTEVDLCGHATLAAAHVLGATEARFRTRSGILSGRVGDDGWITLDLPALPPAPIEAPPGLEAALGVGEIVGVGEVVAVSRFGEWPGVLVELASADQVRNVVPDTGMVARVGFMVVVTAPGDAAGVDFVSRVFAPAAGIAEDPVTGSAHCALGPYWARHVGARDLVGAQVSPRGGVVRIRVGDQRVLLSGQAVTVATANLLIDPPAGGAKP